VALLNGDPHITNRISRERAAGTEFALTTIGLGELYYGAYNSRHVERNVSRIESFVLPNFVVYSFDRAAAEQFGKIQAELRARGRPIPTAEAQIAAIARGHDLTLLTSDAHFASVEGLRLEDWTTG